MDTPFAIYDALSAISVPPEKVRSVVQSLEHDMALFATRTQFDQLDQFSGSRFELLRAEIAATRERLEQIARQFNVVDHRFDQVDQQFDQVDRRFEQVYKRFEQVDLRFEQVDLRFEQVDKRFDLVDERIDDRFNSLSLQLAGMQKQLESRLTLRLIYLLGGAVAFLSTFMALF